jgi:hypothetical protein
MGGSGPGGWTPPPVVNPCTTLSFRSAVNSPKPAALKGIKEGTVLIVELQSIPTTAVVVKHKAIEVGALTGAKIASLINCLQNGYRFKADVVSITGGNCQVEVRPA